MPTSTTRRWLGRVTVAAGLKRLLGRRHLDCRCVSVGSERTSPAEHREREHGDLIGRRRQVNWQGMGCITTQEMALDEIVYNPRNERGILMLSHRNRGEMHPAGLVPNVGGVREFARPATREVKHVVEAIDIPRVLH